MDNLQALVASVMILETNNKKVKDLCPKTFEETLIALKSYVTKNKIKMSIPIKFVRYNDNE